MRWMITNLLMLIIGAFLLGSCQSFEMNRFYKKVNIPHHQWKGEEPVTFQVDIQDTTIHYSTLLYLQHDDLYPYANFWSELSIYYEQEEEPLITQRLEVNLYDSKGNVLGTGTKDIIQHTIAFGLDPKFKFDKTGLYTFSLKHMMRTDPLPMIAVGLLVEKAKGYDASREDVKEEMDPIMNLTFNEFN